MKKCTIVQTARDKRLPSISAKKFEFWCERERNPIQCRDVSFNFRSNHRPDKWDSNTTKYIDGSRVSKALRVVWATQLFFFFWIGSKEEDINCWSQKGQLTCGFLNKINGRISYWLLNIPKCKIVVDVGAIKQHTGCFLFNIFCPHRKFIWLAARRVFILKLKGLIARKL